MKCIQRWLGLVLDLLVAGLAVTVISLAVLFRGSTTGGQIGIALNVILAFNPILLTLVTTWTRMETSLGAIARVKTLVETTISEDKLGEDFIPEKNWPDKGSIEFLNVTASYRSFYHSVFLLQVKANKQSSPDAIALRNVSFKILPGQKIGVCGRTGR
jgi:ABC-type multidrug transport system fused ATPase/permease subunit